MMEKSEVAKEVARSKVIPLGTKVIVEPDMVNKDTGLELPPGMKQEDKYKPTVNVISLGAECKRPIKPGDHVMLSKHGIATFEAVSDGMFAVDEGFILAILK